MIKNTRKSVAEFNQANHNADLERAKESDREMFYYRRIVTNRLRCWPETMKRKHKELYLRLVERYDPTQDVPERIKSMITMS